MRILKTDQYDRWFRKIGDTQARARINARIRRIELAKGLIGDWKPVGEKVVELRVNTGPGYRVYGHVRGTEFILLLIGRDKSTQQFDIKKAKALLKEWEAQNGSQR